MQSGFFATRAAIAISLPHLLQMARGVATVVITCFWPVTLASKQSVCCMQGSNEPLTVNSHIATNNPDQARQGFQGGIDNGNLPQQLKGIGLQYVPGSANVSDNISLIWLRRQHTCYRALHCKPECRHYCSQRMQAVFMRQK